MGFLEGTQADLGAMGALLIPIQRFNEQQDSNVQGFSQQGAMGELIIPVQRFNEQQDSDFQGFSQQGAMGELLIPVQRYNEQQDRDLYGLSQQGAMAPPHLPHQQTSFLSPQDAMAEAERFYGGFSTEELSQWVEKQRSLGANSGLASPASFNVQNMDFTTPIPGDSVNPPPDTMTALANGYAPRHRSNHYTSQYRFNPYAPRPPLSPVSGSSVISVTGRPSDITEESLNTAVYIPLSPDTGLSGMPTPRITNSPPEIETITNSPPEIETDTAAAALPSVPEATTVLKFRCEECKIGFLKKSQLNFHKTSSKAHPLLHVQCRCGKSFDKYGLKQHFNKKCNPCKSAMDFVCHCGMVLDRGSEGAVMLEHARQCKIIKGEDEGEAT
ncbi:hypothetical protein V8C35DRAFT_327175 [Trichoderma chlorosporum]